MMRPEDTLDWLYRRQRLGFTLGLERIRNLLEALGRPQDSFDSVLVGGTNGKGSCARVLAGCLEAAGVHTGLYTSPHLSRIGERFIIRGEESSRERVAAAVADVREDAERLGASFFEVLTAAACLLFAADGVRTAVMEVGLGGRFDATNALEPKLSIVTSVSLDHTDLLGSDPAGIAVEKAGIFRPSGHALTAATGVALESLRREADRLGTRLWTLGEEISFRGEEHGWQGLEITVSSPAGVVAGESPLVGAHQLPNLALAMVAAKVLGAPAPAVKEGLASSTWPGRLERISHRGRWLVFDGAHNEQAAQALARSLQSLAAAPCTLLVGLGRDKDLTAFASALAPLARTTVATRARYSPRARSATEVAEAFGPGTAAVDDPEEALELALELTEEGETLVIAGSLYLVGELRPGVVGASFEAEERWQ